MSDITERLEGCANYFRGTDADVPEWREASNVISRLRLELDMQRAMVVVPSQKDDRHTIEALRAENARLKEALKQIHDAVDFPEDTLRRKIRAARAAMGETDKRINPEYTAKRMGKSDE